VDRRNERVTQKGLSSFPGPYLPFRYGPTTSVFVFSLLSLVAHKARRVLANISHRPRTPKQSTEPAHRPPQQPVPSRAPGLMLVRSIRSRGKHKVPPYLIVRDNPARLPDVTSRSSVWLGPGSFCHSSVWISTFAAARSRSAANPNRSLTSSKRTQNRTYML
jgi:hypothetical protein